MLTCDQTKDLLVRRTLHPLRHGPLAALRRHLAACPSCRQYRRILRAFRAALDIRYAPPIEPHHACFEALRRQVIRRGTERARPRPARPAAP